MNALVLTSDRNSDVRDDEDAVHDGDSCGRASAPRRSASRCARRCRAATASSISKCVHRVCARRGARRNACGSPRDAARPDSCRGRSTASTPGMPASAGARRRRSARAPCRGRSCAWISSSVPSSTFLPLKIMKMRSHSSSAASMSCVEKMIVVPCAAQLEDGVAQRVGVDRVEAGERLVEDEQLAACDDDRRDELHLLRHALRERLDLLVGPRRRAAGARASR